MVKDAKPSAMHECLQALRATLIENDGKIDPKFITNELEKAEVFHHRMTEHTRVCVIRFRTGHEVVGYSQVLDSKNDIEEIGQQIAYRNASNEAWSVFGSVAKVL